jgi:hypothetical protein
MLYYNIGGIMKVKGKKVKVIGPELAITAYLVEEMEKKFIVTNESGNIEIHYPKKDYTYKVVEDK